VIQAIESKALELLARLVAKVRDDERGVVPSEYVVMVAVGVLIAITVVFGVLSAQLTTAIETIGEEINNWVEAQVPFGGGGT
jgi:hypothetical protein